MFLFFFIRSSVGCDLLICNSRGKVVRKLGGISFQEGFNDFLLAVDMVVFGMFLSTNAVNIVFSKGIFVGVGFLLSAQRALGLASFVLVKNGSER